MNNVINYCASCRYRDYEGYELPCRDCQAHRMWEPEEKEKENNEMATTTKKTKTELLAEIEEKNKEIEELKKQVEREAKFEQLGNDFRDLAQSMAMLRNSFMESGFSEEHAIRLIEKLIEVGGASKFDSRPQVSYINYRKK